MELIKDGEFKRRYKLTDKREIYIEINDWNGHINVSTTDGKNIGRIELSKVDEEHTADISYKITWMYLDMLDGSYVRKGIGRECLRFFIQYTGAVIFASENDGARRDDGSSRN